MLAIQLSKQLQKNNLNLSKSNFNVEFIYFLSYLIRISLTLYLDTDGRFCIF